jgi:hypothetical protein
MEVVGLDMGIKTSKSRVRKRTIARTIMKGRRRGRTMKTI